MKKSIAYEQKTGQSLWQKKFYDHILRENDSSDAVAWYIWMKPVRARICVRPEEYPFLGSMTGAWPHPSNPKEWMLPWKTKGARDGPRPLQVR
jgi:hypothetical protein